MIGDIINILFLGGKSAGHIIPNLRFIEYYKDKYNFKSYYLGFKGYIEEKIVPKNIDFILINRPKNKYKFILSKKIYKEIETKLKNIKIDIVISTGGGHSFHGLLYAVIKKIPYYLLEENIIFGSVNKLFKKKSKTVFTAFNIKKNKKYVHALNPSALINKEEHPKKYDFLFIGGSLGSDIIANTAIKMRKLPYQTLLIAGNKYEKYKKYENDNLKVIKFGDTIKEFSSSDVIITRCGSSTLFELIALNKKILMVPSKKTKGNHQVLNAKEFSKQNLGIYINEKNFDVDTLINIKQYDFSSILKSQNEYLENIGADPYEKIIFKDIR